MSKKNSSALSTSNSGVCTQNKIHELVDLMFDERYEMYSFHHNSYNQFINEIVFKELEENQNLIYENVTKDKIYKYKLKYTNIQLKPPTDETSNEDDILFPENARIKFLTYTSRLIADVKQIQQTVNLETGEISEKVIYEDKTVTVAKIPIEFRSNYCSTVLKKDRPTTECQFDPGCYYIIKGSEKIIMSQERIAENKILVFSKKDSNFPDGITYYAQVNSKKVEDLNANLQIISIKMRKDYALLITMSQMQEIPVYIVFKALGIVSDKAINSYIMYNENDTDMNNILKFSLNHYKEEIWKDEQGNINYVRSQEDAVNYLITKMKIIGKRFSETNAEVRAMQRREHLLMVLERDLFPHMGPSLLKKGYYMGLMCHRIINCFLKRVDIDDRDSMINKRIDTPGVLLGQLFRQYYKKMLNDCTKYFRKKNISDENPINIIGQIKHTTIEQGINSALATGTWGNSKKKGVAQMLQRLTYMQLISSLRRVITPQGDASSKVDRMRYVHNTQYGFIDPIETPEHGHNVGTVKQLSNPATITINSASQPEIIKGILEGQVLELTDLEPIKFKLYTRVFLNGEWLGMTDEPIKLTTMLKSKRFTGEIERFVSIAHNFNTKEIKINTDAGRLIRPLLRVENNKLLLTDNMINEINIADKTDPTKIHRWNDFLMKYPNVIEYVDPEEQETLMISFWIKDVDNEYSKMITPIESPNSFGNPSNRYNETVYKRYTHCEFHPSMTCGNISSNAAFSEHNDAPRNYFNFSQARQGLGIYTSNYRHRVDLAYNLYNPQIPLVYPRTSKYTGLLNLPYGQNCVVAIAMYTGYNQEDSILMNQSSIERGLFRAESYKKESEEVSKNPATGQDETFGKPDRNKVAGMKDGNYEKLNDKGFIPEETKVKNNDVLFGKLTPVQPGEASNKIYKDSSLMYKGGVDGVVDRVYTGIKNADGYEMYNMRIRQERVPRGGDKFSSRHGQKGTIGTTLRAEDMPFTAQGIRPDIIINSCCIPSRMTIGQLLEAVVSKSAALEGHTVETTQYERVDTKEMGDILEAHGFERHGLETMYCGFTGKKIQAQIFVCPTYYMRLKHLVQDKIHCLDAKHDVLTLNGWKPIAEITMNDKVATLENDKLVYTNPTAVLHYPDHEGKMYYIKNQAIDLAVTSNHRMYVSKVKGRKAVWQPYDFEPAEKLVGKYVRYKKDAEWDALDYQFILPSVIRQNELMEEKIVDMDSWLIFFGIWFAEGWTHGEETYGRIEISVNKQRVKDALYPALDKLGYTYQVANEKLTVGNKQLYNYMSPLSVGAPQKKLPDWVFKLSVPQVQTLIHGMLLGDGSFAKNGCSFYYTTSVILGDQFQQLCLHAGWACMIQTHLKAGNQTFIKGREIVSNFDVLRLSVIKSRVNPCVNHSHVSSQNVQEEKFIHEKIPVYCLQVPSEVFYVRRNGKAVWTGNSRARGPVTLLTHQPPEGRSRDGGLRFGEMERDVLIAHGIPLFLKEKFMDSSDGYTMYVCGECGLIAHKVMNKNVYICDACKTSDTHKVQLPYAFKLMMQELMSVNILPRIRVEENEFNNSV